MIRRIQRATPLGRGVLIGIGDDAAWVRTRAGSCLLTTDLLLERIHFRLDWTSLYDLGHKSLAVNLSDIAAMGGIPAYALISLGLPPGFSASDIDELYRGIRALAKKNRVALVGGDTNAAQSLAISVCVMGDAPFSPVTRAGAKPGDDIYVTGTLGDSALALSLLRAGAARKNDAAVAYLLGRHRRPTPRVTEGAVLAKLGLARAMIDVSDGLLQDLGHVCAASGVGALVFNESLPLSSAYRTLAAPGATRYALSGGEDYELLFCVRPRDRSRLRRAERWFKTSVTRIGQCVEASDGVRVIDCLGRDVQTPVKGHDHFA
ncbi:MAG TPA: thiamine-phosphate kinase [Candidatus Eisenbacteria bacterium]|nr:thiamine-phosphate kinase [Candidatus Eisenbacteria bacterium]